MVVVDSSVLIPLSWVHRLDLIDSEPQFDAIRTTEFVETEVLIEGKPGVAALSEFFDEHVTVEPAPEKSQKIASMEGIAEADASVILLAEQTGETLLANDGPLVTVAETHGVETWWLTTLLLSRTKHGELGGEEAAELLLTLVERGMNLKPAVFARVQEELRRLGAEYDARDDADE